jgi:soluble lytic murein transglycosylase
LCRNDTQAVKLYSTPEAHVPEITRVQFVLRLQSQNDMRFPSAALKVILILVVAPAWAKKPQIVSRLPSSPSALAELQREIRLQHAHELLGKHYKRSVVRTGESITKINSEIYNWARKNLPKKFRAQYKRIAQVIIDESVKHEFDPVFVLSVIQHESGFDPARMGALDEIGLMQIRPGTASWLSPKYALKYLGANTLRDPVVNIRIGTAYLDFLRSRFDSHARLYLSAFNMGQGNVNNALEKKIWPKDYASQVMRYYVEFYANIKKNKDIANSSRTVVET